jgi:hypothetical protein
MNPTDAIIEVLEDEKDTFSESFEVYRHDEVVPKTERIIRTRPYMCSNQRGLKSTD